MFEFTITGIFIALYLVVNLNSNRRIFAGLIFTSFLPSIAFINIYGDLNFGLQVAYLFGLVFFFKNIKLLIAANYYEYRFILLFLIYCILSLFFPLIFEGCCNVHYPKSYWLFEPLIFKVSTLNQFIYLSYSIIITITIVEFLKKNSCINYFYRILFYSLFIVILIGLFQSFFYNSFSYIYQDIFNNNISYRNSPNQLIFTSNDWLHRMNSTFPEPSILCGVLVLFSPIVLNVRSYISLSRLQYNLLLLIYILSIFLTYSSAGIFSFLLYAFYKFKKILSSKNFKSLIIFISSLIVAFLFFEFLYTNFTTLFYEKFFNDSGKERFEGLILGLNLFLNTYLMGVGFGSNRTADLLSTLLSTVGLIGTLLFLLFIINIIIKLYKSKKICNKYAKNNSTFSILLESFYFGLFIFFIAIPDLIYMPLWFIMALSMAHLNAINS